MAMWSSVLPTGALVPDLLAKKGCGLKLQETVLVQVCTWVILFGKKGIFIQRHASWDILKLLVADAPLEPL